jgi:hypothetical protein
MGDFIPLYQFFLAHAAHLVAEEQSRYDQRGMEAFMAFHLLILDPVAALLALGANLQVSQLFLSGYMWEEVLD